jgi:hypothetical protein
MAGHSTSLDVTSALAAPRACPTCGSENLAPVSDDYGVTFTCLSCQRCWNLELGLMLPVGQERCPTCAQGRACPTHHVAPQQRDAT